MSDLLRGKTLVGWSVPALTAYTGNAGHHSPGGVFICTAPTAGHYEAISRSVAVVCSRGGATGHLPSICRVRGIPVILVEDTSPVLLLPPGTLVRIDAGQGTLEILDSPAPGDGPAGAGLPRPRVPRTKVEAVVADTTDIKRINAGPTADRVASFFIREEFIWTARSTDPLSTLRTDGPAAFADILAATLAEMLSALTDGQRLTFRLLDLRSDEAASLAGKTDTTPAEPNPELGLHGVRRILRDPPYQEALRILVPRLDPAHVTLSLPFINDERELDQTFDALAVEHPDAWGVFVETPAAVDRLLQMLSRGISAVNVGTKDLVQFILAADRNNRDVAHLYDTQHASVLAALERVVRTGSAHGVRAKVFSLAQDLDCYRAVLPADTEYMICAHELTQCTDDSPPEEP
jgi:phosphoenolpyruvate-protein kinase (PTS system EI component)